MKIDHLSIRNMRSFKELVNVPNIPNVTTFIGPNGAGKSAIVGVIPLMKKLLDGKWNEDCKNLLFDRDDSKSQNRVTFAMGLTLNDDERKQIVSKITAHSPALLHLNYAQDKIFQHITYYAEIWIHQKTRKCEISMEGIFVSNKEGKSCKYMLCAGPYPSYQLELLDLDDFF